MDPSDRSDQKDQLVRGPGELFVYRWDFGGQRCKSGAAGSSCSGNSMISCYLHRCSLKLFSHAHEFSSKSKSKRDIPVMMFCKNRLINKSVATFLSFWFHRTNNTNELVSFPCFVRGHWCWKMNQLSPPPKKKIQNKTTSGKKNSFIYLLLSRSVRLVCCFSHFTFSISRLFCDLVFSWCVWTLFGSSSWISAKALEMIMPAYVPAYVRMLSLRIKVALCW